jgi:Putative Actinobacterial Holin-X, holin superfamily III
VQERVIRGRRSLTDVLVDIGRNVEDILRYEIRLAQSEVRERLISAQSAGMLVAVGLVGGVLSAFFLLLSILYALRPLMPAWAAALGVAISLAVIAAIALKVGTQRLRTSQVLRNTTGESVKENFG